MCEWHIYPFLRFVNLMNGIFTYLRFVFSCFLREVSSQPSRWFYTLTSFATQGTPVNLVMSFNPTWSCISESNNDRYCIIISPYTHVLSSFLSSRYIIPAQLIWIKTLLHAKKPEYCYSWKAGVNHRVPTKEWIKT